MILFASIGVHMLDAIFALCLPIRFVYTCLSLEVESGRLIPWFMEESVICVRAAVVASKIDAGFGGSVPLRNYD